MFTWILGGVGSWLGNKGLDQLASIWAKHKDSDDAEKRRQAELARAQLEATLIIRQSTAGNWEQRLLHFMIAFPFVLHAFLVGMDTSFKLGLAIPKYPAPFDEWEGLILLSFFGIQAGQRALTTIATAVVAAKRR